MPNRCIHCSETYSDGAPETLSGCSKCGSRFFFFLSEEKLMQIKKEKVILDFETVKVTSPGKYLLDIPNLFNKERPLVYKLEDGKYVIDLSTIKKK
ncbi:hypothetical protein J4423_04495 [Candidatus Pacearchaeota archaeon]|nr:hypothetical protein [Candidatus Pacearchaeota archaeon]